MIDLNRTMFFKAKFEIQAKRGEAGQSAAHWDLPELGRRERSVGHRRYQAFDERHNA